MSTTADTKTRLMVIDHADGFALVRDLLTVGGSCRYEIDWVPTPAVDFRGVSTVYDAFLVGHDPAGQNGPQVVQSLIKGSGFAVPTIVLTGLTNDDRTDEQALQAGASDCLPKSGLTRELLERSIGHAIERCRILEGLEEARRDQLRNKDEVLSHVSHELRTPVAAIYQFVSLVEDGIAGQVNDGQRQLLSIVRKNVESLSRMINDLLDTSRAQSQRLIVQLRRTSLEKAVASALTTLRLRATEKNVTLVADPVPAIVVQADPGRVVQVIINLVDNAIKYTPSGGCVSVGVAMSPENANYVRVCVTDEGPGINPKDQELLFKPLVQLPQRDSTSRQGLGLGLHICNEIVTRHGGELWVESDPPHGSRFCFTLPMFSISEAVRGTVEKARANVCDVILFEVRLPTKGLASQVAWRLLDQAHWVIRQAMAPGDLVLPASEDDDEHGLIHAVVAAKRSNASAFAARITSLLMEEVDVSSRGMPEVVFDVISAGGDSPDLPGDWVDRAVDRISARVA